MGTTYGQFCPVAKAMELLDERWTMLVLRELVMGSERFNDIRRGVPRMSPSLLSRRMQQLVRAGLVDRIETEHEVRYVLSPAGRELQPVIEAVGTWGMRWIGELGDVELDPRLLMWDMHRRVDVDALPRGRTVIGFDFPEQPHAVRRWWLVLTTDEVDVCDADPGFPVSVTVQAPLRRLTEIWRGNVSWTDAVRDGSLVADGPEALRRALPLWFRWSVFAAVPRAEPSLAAR